MLLTLVKATVVVGLIVAAAWYLVPDCCGISCGAAAASCFPLDHCVVSGDRLVDLLGGLSLALGAFIAGLVMSESEYSHQALAEVLPFRDSFNSLFSSRLAS